MHHTDVLVIGGGINGVGVAAEAAARGLKVILCEKDDLASGTSSASTKLIHGGLRYLEQARFALVRESLRERSILLKRAPHLVHPLKFIFPFTNACHRSYWQLWLGFKLYDWLSPAHDFENSFQAKLARRTSPLNTHCRKAFIYFDAQADDARLVISNAQLARQLGAKIWTRMECIKAKTENGFWLATLKSADKVTIVKARVVVNAAGSWTKKLLDRAFQLTPEYQLRLIKGSHIVLPRLYEQQQAYTLQNPDKRIVFVMPYQNHYTLVGTTDISTEGENLKPEISAEEIDYLLKSINRYFVKQSDASQIVWSYSGLRALVSDDEENPSLISREHKIDINLTSGAPLINILGGKLSSYRALAEKVVADIALYFPYIAQAETKDLILPGGDLGVNFNDFVKQLSQQYAWLNTEIVQRYAQNYGSNTGNLLINAKSLADLGENFGADLYQCEVDYLMKYEWACTPEDILWRRTKLGLKSDIKLEALAKYMEEKIYARA